MDAASGLLAEVGAAASRHPRINGIASVWHTAMGDCAQRLRSRVMLQNELLEVLEETADAALCVNQQGEICSWNAAAEKLFGYSASQAIGKSCYGLLRCTGSLGTRLCTREFYARQTTADAAESPTLTWRSPFVQAGGFGWICQPWSLKMAELTHASW